MNKHPRPTAIHEAGHTLAFWWNGQHISRVTVRSQAEACAGPMLDLRGHWIDAQGLVEADYRVPNPFSEPPGIAEFLPSMIESIERDLMDCFAGPVAEAIYRHGTLEKVLSTSGRGDLKRAQELVALLPARMVVNAQPLAIARANGLVHRYWAAVTALADRLQAQGVVDEQTLSELFCQRAVIPPQWFYCPSGISIPS